MMTEVAKMMISEHLYAFFLMIIRSVDLNANPFVWGLLLWWTLKKFVSSVYLFKTLTMKLRSGTTHSYHINRLISSFLLSWRTPNMAAKCIQKITIHIQYAHQICPHLLYKSVFFAKFISGLLMNLQNAKLLLSFI